MSTYLLVDTSYTLFYRYYATMRWYNFAHPEDKFDDDYDWIDNQIFKNMFEKKYYEGFSKIIKQYEIDESKIIFIRDCTRKDIWRNTYYNLYKANRDGIYGSGSSKIFKGGPFFKYTYDKIIPELIEKKKCQTIMHDNLEADDIIFLTKKYIRNKDKDSKIIIVASDYDLLQLLDENTILINLQNKILNTKSKGDPKLDLEIKIICGDKSDNIEGCFKKCGEKTALKLINDKTLLADKFRKNPGSLDKYALNKILVDMENIPKNLSDSCNKIITSLDL